MNWEAIGAVGEIVGAMAVVASLAYLAIQIRHNTRQLEEQSRTHRLSALIATESSFQQFRGFVSQNPQLAGVWRRGLASWDSLTPDEATQFDYLCTDFFWSWANIWIKVQEAVFFEDAWVQVRADFVNHLRYPGIQQWWSSEANRQKYFDGFVEYASQCIADHVAAGHQPKPIGRERSSPGPLGEDV